MTADIWFPVDDYPLARTHSGAPEHWPQWCSSKSGLRFLIDLDTNDERCGAVRLENLLSDEVCMMMRGHDTPHLPFSTSLESWLGKLVVREVKRP